MQLEPPTAQENQGVVSSAGPLLFEPVVYQVTRKFLNCQGILNVSLFFNNLERTKSQSGPVQNQYTHPKHWKTQATPRHRAQVLL